MARDDIQTKGAILQRDEETYAITMRLPGGVFDIPTARHIADVAEKYNMYAVWHQHMQYADPEYSHRFIR